MPSQEDVDKKLAEYFSRLDPVSCGILAEIENLKNECAEWEQLDQNQKDEILDNHFIPNPTPRKPGSTALGERIWSLPKFFLHPNCK